MQQAVRPREVAAPVQRVVLYDASIPPEVRTGERHLDAPSMADEVEIFQSADQLASLYGMDAFDIRDPQDLGDALEEPLVIVGHGGGGAFLGMGSIPDTRNTATAIRKALILDFAKAYEEGRKVLNEFLGKVARHPDAKETDYAILWYALPLGHP